MSQGHATHLRRQTWVATNPGQVNKVWRHVDAQDVPLGRLASEVAVVLMGKHRPEYTPHVDTGDFVIVTNATKVGLSGKKAEQKFSKRYTGYPGGLKLTPYGRMREQRPERLIELAVRRMLPKNRLGRQMLKKLKVYPGADHPHENNNPIPLQG
ncbi:MAG: 50S ribosomal protein L13 [Planctomycetota bacterium]